MILNEGEEVILMKQALPEEDVDSLEYLKMDEAKRKLLGAVQDILIT